MAVTSFRTNYVINVLKCNTVQAKLIQLWPYCSMMRQEERVYGGDNGVMPADIPYLLAYFLPFYNLCTINFKLFFSYVYIYFFWNHRHFYKHWLFVKPE